MPQLHQIRQDKVFVQKPIHMEFVLLSHATKYKVCIVYEMPEPL